LGVEKRLMMVRNRAEESRFGTKEYEVTGGLKKMENQGENN
jgi:hypothetical protein